MRSAQSLLCVLLFLWLAGPALGDPPPANDGPAKAAPVQRLDAYGDPLPEWALARFGTNRWQHPAQVLAFSPDGRYVAATGTVTRLFDAKTGRTARRFEAQASFLCFSPDGKTLITTPYGLAPTLRFWDVATGKQLRQLQVVGGGNFYPSWSADGKQMAAYSFQQGKGPAITFWDMDSGKEIRRWLNPAGPVSATQATLSPDGKKLAVRTYQNVHLLNAVTGEELRRMPCQIGPVGHTLETQTIAFAPNGKVLASTDNGNVRLWETVTGTSIGLLQTTRDKAVAVAFSRDGRTVAAGGSAGALYLWDALSGKLLHALDGVGTTLPIYLLAFSPDGKKLATQTHILQSIRLWDVASGRELTPPGAAGAPLAAVTFSPDGKTVVSASNRGTLGSFDVATGKSLRTFPGPGAMGYGPGWLAVLPGGKTLMAGGHQGARAWDLQSGKLSEAVKLGGIPGQVHPGCSPDGKTVLVVYPGEVKRQIGGGPGGPPFRMPPGKGPRRLPPPPPRPIIVHWTMIGVWDLQGGKLLRSFRVDAENLRSLVLSPDGKNVAGLGQTPERPGQQLFVWDLARGRQLSRLDVPHVDHLVGVAFSADGRTLLTGPHRNPQGGKLQFKFWETATARERAAVDCPVASPYPPLTAFVGDRLAALAVGDTVHLVDLMTGQDVRRLKGHEGRVSCLAFSPDGKRLVTGSDDTTALVWDTDVPRKAQAKANLSEKELADCWSDLAGEDAAKAYRAVRMLGGSPAQAVAFLKGRLQPVAHPQREQIRRLIANLDGKQFAERERATRELQGLGEVAEGPLAELLKGPVSAEAKRRAEGILAKLREAHTKAPAAPTGETLRALRAVEVLERVGTPEAARLLGPLAEGAPHAALSREARASLGRLTRAAQPTP
jgi:WD40 repeat protein